MCLIIIFIWLIFIFCYIGMHLVFIYILLFYDIYANVAKYVVIFVMQKLGQEKSKLWGDQNFWVLVWWEVSFRILRSVFFILVEVI